MYFKARHGRRTGKEPKQPKLGTKRSKLATNFQLLDSIAERRSFLFHRKMALGAIRETGTRPARVEPRTASGMSALSQLDFELNL